MTEVEPLVAPLDKIINYYEKKCNEIVLIKEINKTIEFMDEINETSHPTLKSMEIKKVKKDIKEGLLKNSWEEYISYLKFENSINGNDSIDLLEKLTNFLNVINESEDIDILKETFKNTLETLSTTQFFEKLYRVELNNALDTIDECSKISSEISVGAKLVDVLNYLTFDKDYASLERLKKIECPIIDPLKLSKQFVKYMEGSSEFTIEDRINAAITYESSLGGEIDAIIDGTE